MNSAPCEAAFSMAWQTLSIVPLRLHSTGLSCTAAARTLPALMFSLALERPGVEDEGVRLAMQEDDVEHVEWIDGPYAGQQRGFGLTIEGLQREAARIDLAPFGHEGADLVVDHQVTGKCFAPQLGIAALDT